MFLEFCENKGCLVNKQLLIIRVSIDNGLRKSYSFFYGLINFLINFRVSLFEVSFYSLNQFRIYYVIQIGFNFLKILLFQFFMFQYEFLYLD